MANKKISELTAASTPLAGTELVPVVQGGVTDRTTTQAIADLAAAAFTPAAVVALLAAATPSQLSTSVYQGAGNGFNNFGLQALQADTSGGGTAAGTRTPSGTKGQALPRLTASSSAGAGFGVDFYTNATGWYRDVSGTGTGGFSLDAVIMVEAAVDTGIAFFGFVAGATNAIFNLASQPTDFTNIVAFAKDSGDVGLQFITRAAGVATKTPLGIGLDTLVNQLIRVQITATAASITYTLTNLETGVVLATGTTSATMPAIDTLLYMHLALQNKPSGGSYSDFQLSFLKMSINVTP